MTYKTNPALLDRLAHALKAQGVELKRSQLLETAAYAFGYRNSNAMTAADKDGALAVPQAEYLGTFDLTTGETIVVVRDALANAPYAIDESFLKQVDGERRESIGVTPYGHMARFDDVMEAQPEPLGKAEGSGSVPVTNVHVGWVSHKHGSNIYVAADNDSLTMQIAQYVRENWNEIENWLESGEDPDTMTDAEVVETYFDIAKECPLEEYLETSVEEVQGRIEPALQAIPVTPHRYTLQHEMDDEPIYIVDQHVKDEDGEPVTVAELPRTRDHERDMAIARTMFAALNGDGHPESGGHTAPSPNKRHAPQVNDDEAYGGLEMVHKIHRLQAPVTTWEHADLDLREITDQCGDTTFSVTADEIKRLSLTFHEDDRKGRGGESLPLTEDEYSILMANSFMDIPYVDLNGEGLDIRLGGSVLYKGRKWFAPTIEFAGPGATASAKHYAESIADALTKAEGCVVIHEDVDGDACNMTILIPFEHGLRAGNLDAWEHALAWLLTPERVREDPQVRFTFIPEVDMNRNVVPVDPKGPESWNGTFDALLNGRKVAEEDLSQPFPEFDEYVRSPFAPEWVRDWAAYNPYTVKQEGLAELFDITPSDG